MRELIAEAERSDCVVEFVPQIGDFIATDEPLFKLIGDAASLNEQKLRSTVAFGPERTMEQDPIFAYRIVIDIALKALSPAINDPTTAVIAIDQLHRLLRKAGNKNLGTDEILDKSGQLRVIFRTPNWEDFVHLAFTEIRHCGAQNIQVVRRLRAMIENLVQTLPKHRHAILQRELTLLDRDIEKYLVYPEDLALTRMGDSQGLGGASGMKRLITRWLPTILVDEEAIAVQQDPHRKGDKYPRKICAAEPQKQREDETEECDPTCCNFGVYDDGRRRDHEYARHLDHVDIRDVIGQRASEAERRRSDYRGSAAKARMIAPVAPLK